MDPLPDLLLRLLARVNREGGLMSIVSLSLQQSMTWGLIACLYGLVLLSGVVPAQTVGFSLIGLGIGASSFSLIALVRGRR